MKFLSPESLRDDRRDRLLHHMQVSAAFLRFRLQTGLSLAEAANRAGISELRLNELETGTGHYLANGAEIAALAQAYYIGNDDEGRFYNSIRYLGGSHNSPVTLLLLGAFICLLGLMELTVALLVRLAVFKIPQSWKSGNFGNVLAQPMDGLWGGVIIMPALVITFLVSALVYTPTTKSRVWLYRARLLVPSSGLSSAPSRKTGLSRDESPAIADFDDLTVAFHGIRQELRQADSRALRRDLIMLVSGTALGLLVNVVTGPLLKFFS